MVLDASAHQLVSQLYLVPLSETTELEAPTFASITPDPATRRPSRPIHPDRLKREEAKLRKQQAQEERTRRRQQASEAQHIQRADLKRGDPGRGGALSLKGAENNKTMML